MSNYSIRQERPLHYRVFIKWTCIDSLYLIDSNICDWLAETVTAFKIIELVFNMKHLTPYILIDRMMLWCEKCLPFAATSLGMRLPKPVLYCSCLSVLCVAACFLNRCIMMTSSNGKNFRVTGPLCGEFTGHQWKASDAELWCFLWSVPE